MKKDRMKKATKYTYIFHWITVGIIFAISVIGAIINRNSSVKSVYVFNAVQSFLFLIASFTPTILKKLQFEIPDIIYVLFVLFISAHFVLGEIFGFFAKVSWWDSILHTFSGFLLTFISYSIISLMNQSKNKNFKLNIYFSALFAFSLTVAIGVVWEIVEYSADSLFGANMQRAYESIADGGGRGNPLVGQAALSDTMKDLILDSVGSICACVLCIILYKTKNIDIGNVFFIKRKKTVLKETEVNDKAENEASQNQDESLSEEVVQNTKKKEKKLKNISPQNESNNSESENQQLSLDKTLAFAIEDKTETRQEEVKANSEDKIQKEIKVKTSKKKVTKK